MAGMRWLITGASRGIGRELASQLVQAGHSVVALVRDPDDMPDLVAQHPDLVRSIRCDATDVATIRSAVDEAFGSGPVDLAVSNAGIGVFAAAEDYRDEDIDRMVATNLVGSIQFVRAVLPHLRAQQGGRIVQISSMGGQIAFPGFAMYHATKWGIEGFFEALSQEVRPFGIRTMLVEPGMVRTGFYDAARRIPPSPAYRGGPADRSPTPLDEMTDSQARTAAAVIGHAVAPDMPSRLLLGSDAYQLVTTAVRERLAGFERQRVTAASADWQDGDAS